METIARFNHCGRVPQMAAETLAKLKLQAQLQVKRRDGAAADYVLKPLEFGRGFGNLPRPSEGDLFFDMEGDPLIVGGLEYLFGVYLTEKGDGAFRAWWAHDANAEREAVAAVLAFFCERIAAYPDAHIYHYNHYEVTALKKLTQRYGVGEAMLDHLLRSKRFVDLYRVVQQAIVASEPGYSLKNLEAFYMEKRTGEVATAGDSIVAYENWLENGDDTILHDIERYNEIDCRWTKGLRDWLLKIRPESASWFEHVAEDAAPVEVVDLEREALRAMLETARERLGPELTDLLFELNAFHGRADKPAWWEYFDRQTREAEELIDDLESLGGLTATAPASGLSCAYAYPKQEMKMRAKDRVSLRGLPGSATIVEMDRTKRQLILKGSKKNCPLPDKLDLVPSGPINNDVLRDAVARITNSLIAGDRRFSAISDFLMRRPPLLSGPSLFELGKTHADLVDAAVAAVVALDASCLPIQGPPGTGKANVSAKAILELVRRGKRVAVASNAHKAIDNLLLAVADQARMNGEQVSIAQKISRGGEPRSCP